MKALTLKQPWAHYVVTRQPDGDYKDVENRSWTTLYRGPLLIHAGAKWDSDLDRTPDDEHVYSAILGVVDLVEIHHSADCHPGLGCSPWAIDGLYHWTIDNPRPFERPVFCTGALQVWNTERLQTIVQQEIEHQLALTGVRA